MRLAMIGAGYVGLVSGACFADFGHDVICVDVDPKRVDRLKAGQMPIFEPGLEQLVARNVAAKRLAFTTQLEQAIAKAEVIFLAVGTPSRRFDGHADLEYVYTACREIAGLVRQPVVIVTKSTVPVGTGDEIERIMKAGCPGVRVSVASNPEFLREGAAIADFKRPDRIVIGAEDDIARELVSEVYRPLYLNQAPIMLTSRRTAELIKYAANAFLATKITFINEMADLCEKSGANVQEVARGIGLDNRIGTKFLHAGPGFGGSCFPKDLRALIRTGQDFGAPVRIVETVAAINDQRKRTISHKVVTACGGTVRGKRIGLLGLSFKPNTDDIRDAPALAIIAALKDAGAVVTAYDPEAIGEAKKLNLDIEFAADAYACAEGADALVIVTEWEEFRALDLDRIRAALRTPILVDLRNIYRPANLARRGFRYVGVGMPDAAEGT